MINKNNELNDDVTNRNDQNNTKTALISNKNVKFDDGDVIFGDDDDDDDVDGDNNGFGDDNNDDDDDEKLKVKNENEKRYPEHLLPRLKIVKKQLKDFETELSTAVHQQNNNNDPQTKEDSSSIRQNLVLDKNDDNSNDIEQPDPVLMMMKQIKRNNNSHHHHHSSLIDHGTITFSANDNDDYLNKRDLWKFNDEFSLKFPQSQFNNNNNYHNGLSKYRTTTTTTNDDSSYELNNKINAFDSLRTSSLKNQQKSLPTPATNQFNQDSLLHIFRRGKSSSSSSLRNFDSNQNNDQQQQQRRRYLLPSLSYPMNISQQQQSKSLSNNDGKNSQIIFYSYRDDSMMKSLKNDRLSFAKSRSSSSNSLPIIAEQFSIVDVNNNNNNNSKIYPSKNNMEVFTIHTDDFLLKNYNNNLSSPSSSTTSMQSASQINEKRIRPTTTISPLFDNNQYESSSSSSRYDHYGRPLRSKKTSTPIFQRNLFTNVGNLNKSLPIIVIGNGDSLLTSSSNPLPLSSSTTTIKSLMVGKNYSMIKESINYVLPPSSSLSNDNNQKHSQQQCDPKLNCRLPKCFCPDVKPPCKFLLFVFLLINFIDRIFNICLQLV